MSQLKVAGMEERTQQLNELLKSTNSEFSIQYETAWKNNIEVQGYILKSKHNTCSPIVYYNKNWYEKSDMEVIEFLTNIYVKNNITVDIDLILEKEYILSHIVPILVSKNNKDELEKKNIIQLPFWDMCIVFQINIDNITEDGNASVKVTKSILEHAEISLDDAYKAAVHNIEKESCVRTMGEILSSQFGLDLPGDYHLGPQMWVCSTQKGVYGSATILCPSVLAKLEEELGEKVVVLPSSVHEVIAVSYEDNDDFEVFRNMVKEVNATEVSINEKLTDSIYIIDDHELKLVAK